MKITNVVRSSRDGQSLDGQDHRSVFTRGDVSRKVLANNYKCARTNIARSPFFVEQVMRITNVVRSFL